MTTRGWTNAEDAALNQLVSDGRLRPEQALAVREALSSIEEPVPAARHQIFEVIGYLGAGLVLGGLVLLIGTSWDQLSRGGRVGLLSAVAALLVGAGLAVGGLRAGWQELRRGAAPVRRRVIGSCFGLAAAAAGFAAGVGVGEFDPALLAAGAVGLIVAAAGFVALPTAPGLLATAAMSFLLVLGITDESGGPVSRSAWIFLLLGLAWGLLAALGALPPRATGLGVGAAIALIGAQLLLSSAGTEWLAYLATLAVALVSLGYYLKDRTLVLLIAGVTGVTLVVPEAVSDWSDGQVSGAALVLIAGAVLLITGGLGLRLHRR